MSQIRPIQLDQQPDKTVKQADITDLSTSGTLANPLTQSTPLTSPLLLLAAPPVETATGRLTSKQAVTSTSGSIIRIPAPRKRLPITAPLPQSTYSLHS